MSVNHECRNQRELVALIDACLILGWPFRVRVEYVDGDKCQMWSIELPVCEDETNAH